MDPRRRRWLDAWKRAHLRCGPGASQARLTRAVLEEFEAVSQGPHEAAGGVLGTERTVRPHEAPAAP